MTIVQDDSTCVFCPQNGKVDIVCDLGSMYLVRAKNIATVADLPDRWLIIPAEHIVHPDELPLEWGVLLNELTHSAGVETDFNWNFNFGRGAGQTEEHLHIWLLDRHTDQLGKGMGWMIGELTRLYSVLRQLTAENERLRLLVTQFEARVDSH